MTHVFFDSDGVMAGFDDGFPRLFGYHHRDVSEQDMWKAIAEHPDFFNALEPMPGALELFARVRALTQTLYQRDPIILTACPKSMFDRASFDKKTWYARHLPGIEVITMQGGARKGAYMRAKGDILIDDWPKNIEAWNALGGRGVVFQNHQQAFEEVQRLLS